MLLSRPAIAVRGLVSSAFETLTDQDSAAERMVSDGSMLLRAGRLESGVYLLGYAAEITLKVAYFRLKGEPKSASARPLVNTARAQIGALGYAAADWDSGHRILIWHDFLRLERLRLSLSNDPGFEFTLLTSAQFLDANWSVQMRYRRIELNEDSATRYRDTLIWVRAETVGMRT